MANLNQTNRHIRNDKKDQKIQIEEKHDECEIIGPFGTLVGHQIRQPVTAERTNLATNHDEECETSNVKRTESGSNKENAEVERSNQLYCFPWVDGKKYDILRSALQDLGINQTSVLGPSVEPIGT